MSISARKLLIGYAYNLKSFFKTTDPYISFWIKSINLGVGLVVQTSIPKGNDRSPENKHF